MNARTPPVATGAAIRPLRGLMYSVLFGLASWGILLGAVWAAHRLMS